MELLIGFLAFYALFSILAMCGFFLARNEDNEFGKFDALMLLFAPITFPVMIGGVVWTILEMRLKNT